MINKPKKSLINKLDYVLDELTTEQKETVLKLKKIQEALFSKDIELSVFNDKNNNMLAFYKIYQYIDENPTYTDKEVTILINDLYDHIFNKKRI